MVVTVTMSSDNEDTENHQSVDEERIEHATDIIGEWGAYQRWVVLVLTTIYIVAPFQSMGIIFYTPKIDFWCKRPDGFENFTAKTCESYEDPSKPCAEFDYDLKGFRSTIIDEYDLVCSRAWLVSVSKSIYQLGYLVSSIVFGVLADKYGRLRTMKWVVVLEIILAVAVGAAPNIFLFIFLRFFLGMMAWARFLTGALIIVEIVGPKYRARLRVFNELGWCVGRMLMPIVAYFVLHFRYMQYINAIYETLFVYFIWQLPESPRWQLTHGQFADAEKTIIKAAKVNGDLSETEVKRRLIKLKKFIDEEEKTREEEMNKTIFDLWKIRSLLRISIIQYFIWFLLAFISNGFNFNISDIGGNLFVTMFTQGFGQTISLAVIMYTVDRCQRRLLGVIAVWGRALCLLSMIPFFFVDNNAPYMLSIVFISQLFSAAGWQAIYLFATELFPTTLRQIGVGSCSVSARIGSTIAPFVKHLTDATHISFTMIFFAVLSVLQGGLFLMLPETQNTELPDTIEEAKAFNERKKNRKTDEIKTDI